MNRRQFLRDQLAKITANVKKVNQLKVFDIEAAKLPFIMADLGADENTNQLENRSMDVWNTDFIIQIVFQINKDTKEVGKLTAMADEYLEQIQLAFNNTGIEMDFINIDYTCIIEYMQIKETFGMISELNTERGIVYVNGTIRNIQKWI